jgi:hypothetical protein
MADLEAIRILHRLRFHGRLTTFSWTREAEIVERYEGLSSTQKAQLFPEAQALREQYEREKGERDLPQALLEMACLYAGSSIDPTGLELSQEQITEWRQSLETHCLDITLHILRAYEGLPLDQRRVLTRYAQDQGIDLPLEVGDHGERVPLALARIGLDLWGGLQDLYRSLSAEVGQQLARDTIEIWESDPETNQEETDEALRFLACLVPGSLRGLHLRLLEEEIFEADELFWNVDPEARDQMIRMVETDTESGYRYFVLSRLAWTRDEVVQAVMHRWRRASGIESYAMQDAGWELTETGERRFFYPTECYRLVPVSKAPGADVPGPVNVITPHEESCPWCGQRLVNLFDCDLQDPRLAFLAPGWSRLRILMCGRCTCFSHVYSDVDPQGSCRWSDLNEHPGFIGDEDQGYDFPPGQLVLGPLRRTPIESRVPSPYMELSTSQIGGFPLWIQSLKPPECPKCQRTMSFVGQLSIAEAGAGSEGMTYAFLCQECRLAVTFYEQT